MGIPGIVIPCMAAGVPLAGQDGVAGDCRALQLAGDATFDHDQHAVAQAWQLLDIGGDQQDSDSRLVELADDAVDLAAGPDDAHPQR